MPKPEHVQKFALEDARVLSKAACTDKYGGIFCEDGPGWCGDYECPYSHDYALQKKLRAIALRLAQRGYGPPNRK